jgi:general L-amino acid transport system permease protein
MSDHTSGPELMYVAPVEAPASRRPPRGTIGPAGWLRANLFSNWLNSLLTVITVLAICLFLYELVSWSVQTAAWGVVTDNLRLLNVYQFPENQIWRIEIISFALMLLSGIGLAIWGGASRAFFLTTAVVIVFMILIPVLAGRLQEPTIRYLVAYDEIERVEFANQVYGPLRFVGDEGQTVQLSIEAIRDNADATADEALYTGLLEATEGTTNSRLRWNAAKAALRNGDLGDLSDYNLLLRLQLIDGEGNVVKEIVSSPDNPNVGFEVELPRDSWYTAIVIVEEDTAIWTNFGGIRLPQTPVRTLPDRGYAWVRIDGVEIFDTKADDVATRATVYGEIPSVECYSTSGIGCQVAGRNFRYEGKRSFSNFMNIQVSPYITLVTIPVIAAILILFFGYWLGNLAVNSRIPIDLKTVNQFTVAGWLIMFPISWYLLSGVSGASDITPVIQLPEVSSRLWGGLTLTLVLTFFSVTLSLPIGVVLALGRRSGLPVIGTFSILFIELIRGAPLITILFFAKHVFPFFASSLRELDDVIRMLVGLTLFSAAYNAEIVRGGLQIIPKGQVEAAQALGLNPFLTNTFIILPQAIRAVIPALMSQFVSLFKDTTLVSIIGLYELLGVVELIVNGQARYRSAVREAYLYVGIIYFVIAFIMSMVSRRLEETGSGAARR